LNLDPTFQRVCLIGFLLMFELFLIKVIEVTSQGRQPTLEELELFFALGLLQLVTYVLAFLRKEET